MIYVSSACSTRKKIADAVQELADQGFQNIELTGGTRYYAGFESDLIDLKQRYGLNYLIHNYFPPPETPFILNLASLDPDIYDRTLSHLKTALGLSRLLGADRFGFHAGFFVDRPVAEIGKQFGKSGLYPEKDAVEQFTRGFRELAIEFKDIRLYIENNCYSQSNHTVYSPSIPFMLLGSKDVRELKELLEFNLLLDVGHLLVSSNSCGLAFENQFEALFSQSDYIHISDNDSLHDRNLGLTEKSSLLKYLSEYDWKDKIITLEVYAGMPVLKKTFDTVSRYLKRRTS